MNIDNSAVQALMMAVLDGEADAAQIEELNQLLASDSALQTEFAEMKRLKEITMGNKPHDPEDALWQSYWSGVYKRLERGIGWVLFSVGAIALLLFAGWEMTRDWLTNSELPIWVRTAGALLGAGTVILFVSVLRETLFHHKHERYKDIQR